MAIDAEVGVDETADFDDVVTALLGASDRLEERGLLPSGRELRMLLTSHADAIRYMHTFCAAARLNWSADVTFDDQRLERLLRGSGYLTE